MGRPPIGNKAMTEAERKRRQRAGLATKRAEQHVPKPTEPVPKQDVPKSADRRDEEIANNLRILGLIGIDTRGLSIAEIAQGAGIAARLSREDCAGGARVDKVKAAAEWRAFCARVGRRQLNDTLIQVTGELEGELAQAKARIAELEKERGKPGLTRSTRGGTREEDRLRAEIAVLKSDNAKLKMLLKEEPDAAKLRKQVVDQQTEMASLRRVMKEIAKERDKNKMRRQPKYREGIKLLTRRNHALIIKALHSDRSEHVSKAELAAAERLAIALRPLFIED
jgi:hypothetical protein